MNEKLEQIIVPIEICGLARDMLKEIWEKDITEVISEKGRGEVYDDNGELREYYVQRWISLYELIKEHILTFQP